MIFRSRIFVARGQAAVEFALLTPIVFFLLFMILQGYKLNTRSSQEVLEQHQIKLDKLDHGNGSFELDGVDIPPGSLTQVLPDIPNQSLGDSLLQSGTQLLAHIGLNAALNKIPLFDGKTYVKGALRGGVQAGGDSFIDSGFKTVDWEKTGWGAVAGALSSQEATEDFQGQDYMGSSSQEAFGSALQSGAIAYAKSGGDAKAALAGGITGLMGSDTVNQLQSTKYDVLLGAAKGAVQGTVTGALEGKVDLKSVAISTGMGAFNTRTVAEKIPLSNWKGDARQSASFQAVNAALSTVVSGGNAKQALLAGASGAFFSGQSMSAVTGAGNPNVSKGSQQTRAMLVGTGYGAATGLIAGGDVKAVGISAAQGMATGLATQLAYSQHIDQLSKKLGALGGTDEVIDYYDDVNYQKETAEDIALQIEDQGSNQAMEDALIYIMAEDALRREGDV